MNQSNNDQQFLFKLSTLFLLSVEGMITDEQFKELNRLLVKHPVVRDYYYDFITSYVSIKSLEMFAETDDCRPAYLDHCLQELAKYEIDSPAVDVPKSRHVEVPATKLKARPSIHRISKLSVFSIIMSSAALIFMVLFIRLAPPVHSNVLVGQCIKSLNATGYTFDGDIFPGCNLYSGPVTLTEGFLELQLNGGTDVIVEAPAEFVIKSATRINLQKGSVVVKIGEELQESFVVSSYNASIVDYGTEFGVHVDDAGNTITHIYQGKAELRTGLDPLKPLQRLPLEKNQGGLANLNGQVIPKKDLTWKFVRRNEFETKVLAAKGDSYHKWLEYSYQLRRDPSLVAYYTFERLEQGPTVLQNMAASTYGQLNGILAGQDQQSLPIWVEGRWPKTTSMQFDREQKQYIEVPSNPALGVNGPITIAAWVDCSGEKDGGHIVSNRVGVRAQSNYQFGYRSPLMNAWKHSMHLSRKSNNYDSNNQLYSKKIPDISGWMLIAVTHDNKVIKFYVNGKIVDSKPWERKQKLVEGGLMIGSDFSPNDPSMFNGKISELVIASRVFGDSEIEEMYKAGRP